MSNYPGTYIPPLAPAAGPPRRTYGKKRILDPELLDLRDSDLPMKKSRTLAPLPVNASKASTLPKQPLQMTSSPVKRVRQDQNALDSPFLEPRAKRGVLRRTSSTRKSPVIQLPPKPITSRHFSLNQNLNGPKDPKPKHQDELRRKTSEATTTVFVPMSGQHSWLVPPPLRPRAIKTRYMSSGDAEFSFNPPAESTLHQGSPTPRANMHKHRKRHDSILSTDSDDDGDTVSVTGLFGAPPLPPKVKPKPKVSMDLDLDLDDDATPRARPLIEQFCRPRSGSANATIRPLYLSFRQSDAMDADDEMDANREAPVKRPDPALRALADACASMGLDEPDRSSPPATRAEPSSPTDRPATRHRKTRSVPGPGRSSHQAARRLSPRAVCKLSQWPRVGMRIETKALSPNEDVDMFATYDFDK